MDHRAKAFFSCLNQGEAATKIHSSGKCCQLNRSMQHYSSC
jgi:hypothetical protein